MATASAITPATLDGRRPIPPAEGLRQADPALARFAHAQAVNVTRNAASLRPFRASEFGEGAASPSRAHIEAANGLIARLRGGLLAEARRVRRLTGEAGRRPAAVLVARARGDRWIKLVEQIWDHYLELFSQRQSRFATMLLAADRIGLDCYQAVYTGLGSARSIPAPPPFCYMETGSGPATFRRGVPLSRLGKQANPFPTIELPYHRLVNPWTLGAVHHEVAHNLQSDLGLWHEVPRRLARRLGAAGLPPAVAATWARWHKEIWADLCGLLLGGPAVVASLIDVIARHPAMVLGFNPSGVHPTPYLRTLINLELLRRIGFADEAAQFERLWARLYPAPRAGGIPAAFLDTFPAACRLTVDTLCFQPYGQLGGRSLAQVVRFRPVFLPMVAEAAARLAAGNDPGIIPARFLVGAARVALDRRMARPGQIARNFYRSLAAR